MAAAVALFLFHPFAAAQRTLSSGGSGGTNPAVGSFRSGIGGHQPAGTLAGNNGSAFRGLPVPAEISNAPKAAVGLSAAQNESDAYVEVRWVLPNTCFLDPGQPGQPAPEGVYVEVIAMGDESVVDQGAEVIYAELIQQDVVNVVRNSMRHFVGPGHTVVYKLNTYLVGPGHEITACSNLEATGQTLPYQAIEALQATDEESLHEIKLSWESHSDLPNEFIIHRTDEAGREVVAGTLRDFAAQETVFTFTDSFVPQDSNSIQNGEIYTYRITAYSERFDKTYNNPEAVDDGETVPIAFNALSQPQDTLIALSWADIRDYATRIALFRNDQAVIEQDLSDNPANEYTDFFPVFGQFNTYRLQAYQEDELLVEVEARDTLPPFGYIAGAVRTPLGVGLKGVEITATATIRGQAYTYSDTTDDQGLYQLDALYFRDSATFTVRAVADGQMIGEEPVGMSRAKYRYEKVNFGFSTELPELADDSLRLINPGLQAGLDELAQAGECASSRDTVYFQLYREGQLVDFGRKLDALSDDTVYPLKDRTGQGRYNYLYEVRAYLYRNDSALVVRYNLGNNTFPEVTPVAGLQGGIERGVVRLDWSNPSANITGFRVYRDMELVEELPSTATSFLDFYGFPGETHQYEVTAYRKTGTRLSESEPEDVEMDFPPLPVPQSLGVEDKPGYAYIDWNDQTDPPLEDQFFTGYKVFRNDYEIGTILKGDTTRFTDLTVLPFKSVSYRIAAFLQRPDTTILGEAVTSGPIGGTSDVFTSDAYDFNYSPSTRKAILTLNPDFSSSDFTNADGFIFRVNLEYHDTIRIGEPASVYHFNGEANNFTGVVVRVRPFKEQAEGIVSGPLDELVFSGALPVDNDDLEAPSNFQASEHLASHVVLTWDYPVFKLSDFVIYKDGEVVDTLPTVARAFYDQEAIPGQSTSYAIQAIYQSSGAISTSVKVGDQGKRLHGYRVKGRILPETLPSLALDSTRVELISDGRVLARGWTNDAGAFVLPAIAPTMMGNDNEVRIRTEGRSLHLVADALPFDKNELESGDVFLTFRDQFQAAAYPDFPQPNRIARVINAVAEDGPRGEAVLLSWQATPGRLDGFEVYRNTTLLARMPKRGSTLYLADSTGVGGIDYDYSITPYAIVEGRKLLGASVVLPKVFPRLAAVDYLTATPNLTGFNTISLQWSHPTAEADLFRLIRNGVVIGELSGHAAMEWVDSTGIPGQLYSYELEAVRRVNGSELGRSPLRSVQVRFPGVVAPHLEAVPDPDRNGVLLSWSYEGRHVSGFQLFRSGELIGQFAPDSLEVLDQGGFPGASTSYELVALLERNGQLYPSLPEEVEVVFPVLHEVDQAQLEADESLGLARLKLPYAYEAIDAVELQIRSLDAGGTLYEETLSVNYEEIGHDTVTVELPNGWPGREFEVKLRALATRQGVDFFSEGTVRSLDYYPDPPMGTALEASDDEFENRVELTWQLPFEANVDKQRILRGSDIVATLPAGQRTFSDVINGDFGGPFLYTVLSIREAHGQIFRSGEINNDHGSCLLTGANENLLTEVTASDGTFKSRTLINWSAASTDTLQGYRVYRDDEPLATLNPTNTFYNDTEGVPGQEYVYRVEAIGDSGEAAQSKADRGHRQSEGRIAGRVQTAIGGAPVAGAEITAVGIIGGEEYRYEAVSGPDGKYSIEGVFYGEETAAYTVSVSYQDHEFINNNKEVEFTPQIWSFNNITFFDNTAYVVEGRALYAGTDIAIPGATVMRKYHFTPNTQVSPELELEEVMTDKNGRYSFNVQPDLEGLQRIEILISETSQFLDGSDTLLIRHDFEATTQAEFANLSALPTVTELNFEDRITYDFDIAVTTVCGGPPTDFGRYEIEVNRPQGGFFRTALTNANGQLTLSLPPVNGLQISVREVEPKVAGNLLVRDYLRPRPATADILALHQQYDASGGALNLDSLARIELVYHKPAGIQLLTPFGTLACGDPDRPRVIMQGEEYTVQFAVSQTHRGQECPVTEGYLVINNSAAEVQTQTIELDENGQFLPYAFTGGFPNLVAPHLKGVRISYFSPTGDLLAERRLSVLVTGTDQLPGNDIIVELNDDQFKLPVLVLRDPPGDHSYSYIEEGETVSVSYVDYDNNSYLGSAFTNQGFTALGLGFFANGEVGGTVTDSDQTVYSMEFTTRERISTSADPRFVGRDADVLVGVGMSTQYGIGQQILLAEEDCAVEKREILSIAPNGIRTDWLYTVEQIEALIEERERQIQEVEAGLLQLAVDGVELSTESTIVRLETERNNWENVLDYHGRKSVPYNQLCAMTLDGDLMYDELKREGRINECGKDIFGFDISCLADDDFDGLDKADIQERVNNAKEEQESFCSMIGNGQGADFVPNETVIFDNSLKDAYTRASSIMGYWLDSLYLEVDEIEDRISDVQAGIGLFEEVENTTFSGGIEIEKQSVVRRFSSSEEMHEQEAYFQISGGFLGSRELTLSTGFGVIVGTTNLTTENRIGLANGGRFRWGHSYYTDTTIQTITGYVLSDDDPGDQFSVTAIKARTPGHSPYFQLLGGRSSCPPEEGAIQRDQVDLALYDPETQSTFDFLEQRNLAPDDGAVFYLQMTNLNPFGEARDVSLYVDGLSNPNGAIINLNGDEVGTSSEDGVVFNTLAADNPIIVPIVMERSIDRYQFDSIGIILRPSCIDGDPVLDALRDTVYISTYFDHPCSDVTITSPGNDWVINARNPLDENSREQLEIKIQDYEVENTALRSIELQYRPIGTGASWQRIAPEDLAGGINPIPADTLLAYNAANFGPGEPAAYYFIWDITENNTYFDGIYEVRAISNCGTDGRIFSNIIRGRIARQVDRLFGVTEPADERLQIGDEISIRFNQDIGCGELDSLQMILRSLTTGDTLEAELICFNNDNTLLIDPALPIQDLDGQELQVQIRNVRDPFGNTYEGDFEWSFEVIGRDVFVLPAEQELSLYQSQRGAAAFNLFTTVNASVDFQVQGLADYPWLSTATPSGTAPSGVATPLVFEVDAGMLPVGDTVATLTVASQSGLSIQGSQDVKLKVNVFREPPYWNLDPSQYSSTQTVIANYSFSGPEEVSTDSLDLISVWMDNEIRGIGQLREILPGEYAAVIAVYGNAEDAGRPLQFRVWDADPGIEYNAYPGIYEAKPVFGEGSTIGTFAEPELLLIDPAKNRARYIPVNGAGDGGGGYTWLSFNSEEPDNSVNAVLRELQAPQDGDILKTRDQSAGYVEGLGWFSLNGLDTIQPEDGYLLYLNGPDDTLRVTGRDAAYSIIELDNGWNLIGFPLQQEMGINEALQITPSDAGEEIKTVPQAPGLNNQFAMYDASAGMWLASNNMQYLRPNYAYQLKANDMAFLDYPGATDGLQGGTGLRQAQPLPKANPADPSTWQVDPSQYPSSMVLTATVHFDSIVSIDPQDRVAAFINGVCRGTAQLGEITALDQFMVAMLIYGSAGDEEIELLLYDASADRVYRCTDTFEFIPDGIAGSFGQPLSLYNSPAGVWFETREGYCAADTTAGAEITWWSGLEPPLTFTWSNGQEGAALTGVSPGIYHITLTDGLGLSLTDSVTIGLRPEGVPVPEIGYPQGTAICLGAPASVEAYHAMADATVHWNSTTEGFSTGVTWAQDSLNSHWSGTAVAMLHGCPSDSVAFYIEVVQPSATFSRITDSVALTGHPVVFSADTLAADWHYEWDFGDGTTATGPVVQHTYPVPGNYISELRVQDALDCTHRSAQWVEVQAPTAQELVPSGPMPKIIVMPNPFDEVLTITLQAPKADTYHLDIRNYQGQLLWEGHWQGQGQQQWRLPLQVPNGYYLVRMITGAGHTVTLPVLKQNQHH